MNQRRILGILLLSVLALALTLAGVARAAAALEIDRWVVASGGAHVEAGSYALDGAIGQAFAGNTSNAPYRLCAGFWCGAGVYSVYLPVVMRTP